MQDNGPGALALTKPQDFRAQAEPFQGLSISVLRTQLQQSSNSEGPGLAVLGMWHLDSIFTAPIPQDPRILVTLLHTSAYNRQHHAMYNPGLSFIHG